MCLGNVNEWVKCDYTNDHPMRKPFSVHDGFSENEYLQQFEFKAGRKVCWCLGGMHA